MKHASLVLTILIAGCLLSGTGRGGPVRGAEESPRGVAASPSSETPGRTVSIVTAPTAGVVEKVAAQELARYLKRLYPDYDFPVRDGRPSSGREILLGIPADWPLLARFVPREQLAAAESFRVVAAEQTGVVAGADPRGVLFAVYALLEKLGCGFYLSSESVPEPKDTPFDFSAWALEDRPLCTDRIVFDWHNFLSSASTWELEDWQQYLGQAAKMRFNTVMVHAYGNNPIFTFHHNGQTKPVGYLATTHLGRDWGTEHVNDVRRLVGGAVFAGPVFGSSAALVPDEQRVAAATDLMRNVFAFACSRGLHVTFALDVDTESANPQNVICTLPAEARLSSGMRVSSGKESGQPPGAKEAFLLANPDTPAGFAYYRDQIRQLLEMYPQIDRLALWFRTSRTPWRSLSPEQFPPAWKAEFDAAMERDPRLRKDDEAAPMFVMGRLVRTFQRVLRDLGRTDVEVAAGSWHLSFLRAADSLFPPEVPLMPLDWGTIYGTEGAQRQFRQIRSGRKLIPIVWAHHDDLAYIGRPYQPFAHFASQLRADGAAGFGIIHWTTRPLDLYFRSLSEQVWQATADRPLAETCEDFAAHAFGAPARTTGGEYLRDWLTGAPMFGRETSNRFMDVPLKDVAGNLRRFDERQALLGRIDEASLPPAGRERLAYYRDYERFLRAFYQNHTAWERAVQLFQKGEREAARDEVAKCHPEEVIRAYVQAATRERISRGEQALVISLNLRWRPCVVSLRQALGLEPVRIKFLPTRHEPLAQGPGTNTFYVDQERQLWQGLGQKETGCPTFELPEEGAVDGLLLSGLRIDKPVTLRLGAMTGDKLVPGRYRVTLLFTQPSQANGGRAELELRGSHAEEGIVRSIIDTSTSGTTGAGGIAREVQITEGQLTLTLRPQGGPVFLSGVVLAASARDIGPTKAKGDARSADPEGNGKGKTPGGGSAGYFPPPESQGGWQMLDKPDAVRKIAGMDPAKLEDLQQWLLQSDKRTFAAVVIRRGCVVLQVERGNSAKTDSRRVASVSKAVCATVLAIASEQSQQGLTPRRMTFDDPAFQFIPWAEPLSDPRKAQITVKQLLNHTSGLCPEATGAPNDGTWEYVLGLSGDRRTARLAFDPGTACGYSTIALHHAALVCETVTGKPYDAFAIEALFRPLGIEHWWFQYFHGGEKIGRHPTHGLGMPARDLARIAYCMLREGRWGDRQVIPRWFVDQTAATTHNVTSPEMRWKLNPQTFSHGWELPAARGVPARASNGIPADARYKPGSGGQLIAFVPSLDLVVARQTGGSGEWAYEEYLRRACAAVLPAIGENQGQP